MPSQPAAAAEELPYGGDLSAASKAMDRDAIRTLMRARDAKSSGGASDLSSSDATRRTRQAAPLPPAIAGTTEPAAGGEPAQVVCAAEEVDDEVGGDAKAAEATWLAEQKALGLASSSEEEEQQHQEQHQEQEEQEPTPPSLGIVCSSDRFHFCRPSQARDTAVHALYNDEPTMLPHLPMLCPISVEAIVARRARHRAECADGSSLFLDIVERSAPGGEQTLVGTTGFRTLDAAAASAEWGECAKTFFLRCLWSRQAS